MLTIKKTEGLIIIQTKSYIITINKNNPFYANLFDMKKNNICSLFLLSGCDSDRDWERIHNISQMNVNQKNKCIKISFSSKSLAVAFPMSANLTKALFKIEKFAFPDSS